MGDKQFEISDEALAQNLRMLEIKYALNYAWSLHDKEDKQKKIIGKIQELKKEIDELELEYMKIEVEWHGYEIGKEYCLTEKFHKAFPSVKAKVATIKGFKADEDGRYMIVLSIPGVSHEISFSVDFGDLIEPCP